MSNSRTLPSRPVEGQLEVEGFATAFSSKTALCSRVWRLLRGVFRPLDQQKRGSEQVRLAALDSGSLDKAFAVFVEPIRTTVLIRAECHMRQHGIGCRWRAWASTPGMIEIAEKAHAKGMHSLGSAVQ